MTTRVSATASVCTGFAEKPTSGRAEYSRTRASIESIRNCFLSILKGLQTLPEPDNTLNRRTGNHCGRVTLLMLEGPLGTAELVHERMHIYSRASVVCCGPVKQGLKDYVPLSSQPCFNNIRIYRTHFISKATFKCVLKRLVFYNNVGLEKPAMLL